MKKKLLVFIILFAVVISNISAKKYKPAFDLSEFTESVKEELNISIERKYKHCAVLPDGWENSDKGFVLYPGAYVDFEAYIPLMVKIAESGIPCFITRMPHDLAIMDWNRADIIISQPEYENIKYWYIGGHSLGGVEASKYAKLGKNEISGVVLMASYSIYDLSKLGIPVISIYGSNDGVLNLSKYEKNKKYLPEDLEEVVLEGGNHAGFGVYGNQNGDNSAVMTAEEQLSLTAESIIDFID